MLAEHGYLCHVIIHRLQFAPPIMLDEMPVIDLEALEEIPDSNVRFCLAEFIGYPGRKANV
jgi:hypothetical protein